MPNPEQTLALLKQCAELRGLSGGFVFSMDAVHVPDKTIMHFVRLETIAFDCDSEPPKEINSVMDAELDPRLSILAGCFIPKDAKAVMIALQALTISHGLIMDLRKSFPDLPGVARDAMDNVLRMNEEVLKTYA